MNNYLIKKVTLAYFSGTGGTRFVTDCFEKELAGQRIEVKKIDIVKVPPDQALSSRIMKFTVLSDGFDIESIKSMSAKEIKFSDYSDSKDLLWQGLIDYLHEK